MANIEIDLDVIDKKLSSTTTKIANKCTKAYNYADSVKASLPYRIKEKNNINEKLSNLKSNCNILENNFNRLEKSIIRVLNRYVKYEHELTSNAKKINPKEVKVKEETLRKIKTEKTDTIKVNYANINKINHSMQKEFISNTLFNKDIAIKVSNYDSGVCAAVMMECKSIITDTIQIDDTYYFQNLNTQQVVENNITILNDADIDKDKEMYTRTVKEILGVSSNEYVNSIYMLEHVNDIDNKVKNDSALDHVNKNFNDNYKNDTKYNNNDKIINNIKDNRKNSLNSEITNNLNFHKKETSIAVETLSTNTEKLNTMEKAQSNIEYERLEDNNIEVINNITSKSSDNYEKVNIRYEDII